MEPEITLEKARAAAGSRRLPWVLLIGAVLSVGGYLLTSSRIYGIGFPLDDAWIHQTYARNLAQYGQWAFFPGQPSAGSTAPLWSALLALGDLLHLGPYIWAYLLGGLSLFGLAFAGEAWLRSAYPDLRSPVPWAGLFLLGEWHLAWAAVSGMETLLIAVCILWVMWQVSRAAQGGTERTWGLLGLLIGLSVWIRPDGITLLGPAVFTLCLMPGDVRSGDIRPGDWRKRIRGLVWLGAGVALLFVPYLLFNWLVQGSIWPNTFYAKQAEYAVQRQLPIWTRFFDEVKLPLIGSGFFLLPGFIAFTWKAVRERDWAAVGAVLWFLGYALLYALRLPVTYQYGRYFMPAMPVYFVAGLVGSFSLLARLHGSRLSWLVARVAVLSAAIVWLAFYSIGAGRYAQDVAIIETEMVSSARWVATNTPADTLIAAHDIGALGYFGQRRLVDLAGLVSPEVIPFIRDEARIASWLDEQQVDYLVVMSGWYTRLPEGKTPVYVSSDEYAAPSGGGNISVYRWRP